jgi:hypothetical protein
MGKYKDKGEDDESIKAKGEMTKVQRQRRRRPDSSDAELEEILLVAFD